MNNRSYRPFLLASGVLLLTVFGLYFLIRRATGGLFMYPIDDSFIHMVVARNLAFQGNWGIAGHEFASASSSILYTLILAGLFKIFSVNIWISLAVNIISGVALLAAIQRWLEKEDIKPRGQLLILIMVIVLTPLPIIIISGMEHTLQCLFAFLFVFYFSDAMAALERGEGTRADLPWKVYLYGFLVCFIRYEGLFLVGVACLVLLYNRRVGIAFKLGILSFIPLLCFGVYSLLKGSYFLPNSVLLKADGLQFSLYGVARFFGRIFIKKLNITLSFPAEVVQHLLILLPLAYLMLGKRIQQSQRYGYILFLLAVCCLLQISLAGIGWFYRYEAYLVLCSVVILCVLGYKYKVDIVSRMKRHPLASGFVVALLVLPLLLRTGEACWMAPKACANIYDQQYQMAQFLARYYDNTVVAVNDIGAVSYYKRERNLDLFGLANIKVARRKKNNDCTPGFLDSLSRAEGAKIAVIFDSWFSDSLLHRWDKIASWKIPNNVICGDSVVSFYAIDSSESGGLRRALLEYAPRLPSGVEVKYFRR
jgi:hypothetical protein